MEPIARLYNCTLCHIQSLICSKCDHGQIYCGKDCAVIARRASLKEAGIRYQSTPRGKRNHAARQARYEMKLKFNLTHHPSLEIPLCAPMQQPENNAEKTKTGHQEAILFCCFCEKPVSDWLRNDFLRRREHKKLVRFTAYPQAP